MKDLLTYHESNYFNDKDYYLLYNDGLKKYNLTMLELYNGSWYSLLGLNYKMTSIPCINSQELSGLEVTFEGTPIKGKLSLHHRIDDNFGVHWESGPNIKNYGLPYFWNEPKNLKL